ncbi:MAG: TetR/AcrR family transcriptional regulator [Henriciella sp.]|nr:TetR/AcrR family transcriptional regulator [Henriciella sp.]
MSIRSEKPRQRLAPEKRRALILDHAAEMLTREGVALLTMERIGQEAGISKSLVYNYFANLTELLRALLERELKTLRRLQFQAAESAVTLEELIQNVTHVYLKYISERGQIIERLQAEPSVSSFSDPTEYSRDGAVSYIAEIVSSHLEIPHDIAVTITDISFGIPAAAGDYLLRSDEELEKIEKLTVSMILGSIMMVRNDHFTRSKVLRRFPRLAPSADK